VQEVEDDLPFVDRDTASSRAGLAGEAAEDGVDRLR